MTLCIRWRIVLGPLLDPGTEDRYFIIEERSFAFGHPDLAVQRRYHLEYGALVGMLCDHGGTFTVTPGEQPFEIGHHIAALGFGGLMASLAIRLEDGADVVIIADFSRRLGFRSKTDG